MFIKRISWAKIDGWGYVDVVDGINGVYRLLIGAENVHIDVDVGGGRRWGVGGKAGILGRSKA